MTMKYSLTFDPKVLKTIGKWKKSNPALFKKLDKVLKDISEHPRMGIGHPEPLIGGKDVTWSRHITAHDRIIYEINDDRIVVLVIDVEGHYNDK